jgi:signal transduction histidine kinase
VRLAQVFGNLLTNAAKFTPPGGWLRVAVVSSPGRVKVSIEDNGRGIAPASSSPSSRSIGSTTRSRLPANATERGCSHA